MQTAWSGQYLDGKTAKKHDVAVELTGEGLRITLSSGEVRLWPYLNIRQTQGYYQGDPVQLEFGDKLPEVLLFQDVAFLEALHQFSPAKARRFHNPTFRKARVRLTVYAAVGVVASVIFMYAVGIPLMAMAVSNQLPLEWEQGMGDSVLNHIAPAEARCQSPQLQEAIDEMIQRYADTGKTRYTYRVYVADSPMFNAFALPGGYIVIMRGLLEKTASPEELAAVMAHEIQHVEKRHVTRKLIEDASIGLMISAIIGDVSGAAVYGVVAARTLTTLSYSRRSEREADEEGMKMFIAAGLDPRAMIRFYKTMEEDPGQISIPQYLSTHPQTGERIERLRNLAVDHDRPDYTLLSSHDRWEKIKYGCN
ncbi:MAG: M48 family metallopeptidase [Smithellaceae bacterium]